MIALEGSCLSYHLITSSVLLLSSQSQMHPASRSSIKCLSYPNKFIAHGAGRDRMTNSLLFPSASTPTSVTPMYSPVLSSPIRSPFPTAFTSLFLQFGGGGLTPASAPAPPSSRSSGPSSYARRVRLVYGGPRPSAAAFSQAVSHPRAMTPADAQPVRLSISRRRVIVHSRCAASWYWVAAKNSGIVDSVNTAPKKGERLSFSGKCMPAAMRPMRVAYGWVAGAPTPAAIMAAGGMAGCERRRMILERCKSIQIMLTS
jgi:hypothetical protein